MKTQEDNRAIEDDACAVAYIGDRVLELLASEPRDARILDIATGRGYMLRLLDKAGFSNLLGADINEGQFALDRKRFPFTKVDANAALPFTDASFDIAISSETIEHVENPRQFLRELHRVLRPGGTLILTTPNVGALASRLHFLISGMLEWHREAHYRVAGHITVLPDWAITRMFGETGFKLQERTWNCGYVPMLSILNQFKLRNHLLNPLFGWISIYRCIRA